MKKLYLISLLLLPACVHQTIENVFACAQQDYEAMLVRYHTILQPLAHEDLIEQIRLIGNDNSLSFWSCLGQSFLGNQHLVSSEGAPLHRAVYFMENDTDRLARHVITFERRGLMHSSLYQNMINLRRMLLEIMRIIKAHKTYISESQFIEQQRLQRQQLYQQTQQTYLLQQIAEKEQEKTVVHCHKKPTVIKKEEYTIYL